MNCKKGDLAVVARRAKGSPFDFTGAVVTCVRFVGDLPGNDSADDFWLIDRRLNQSHEGHMSDSLLRPIRDQPGADETLLWAPVPNKQTEVA